MKKTLFLVLLAGLSLTMGSCTIKDDEPSIGGSGSGSGKLTSITAMSMQLYAIDYDQQGRIKQISDGMMGLRTFISYSPLEIRYQTLDVYYDGDREFAYVDSELTWKNITTNSSGFITSYQAVEQEYNYDGALEFSDTYPCDLTYNSNGNLESIILRDYNDPSSIDVTTLTWENGLLTKTFDGVNHEFYSYDGDANVQKQWVPWWSEFSSYAMTGFLGNPPTQLVSTYSENPNNYYSNEIKFIYSLTSNGYIERMMMQEDGENSATFNFRYLTTKSPDTDVNFQFRNNHSNNPFRKVSKK